MKYDVSIIVASYNPNWEKLKKTVNSILLQKNISYELIICDDGSEFNYFDKLNELINGKCFYTLISSDSNEGTCKNYYKGIKIAVGKYIKVISPGDYLYDEFCLDKWISFMKKNEALVCFGNAIYYTDKNKKTEIVSVTNNPQNPYMFKNKNSFLFNQQEDYLICNNLVLGANFLVERDLCLNYLSKIINKVIYAEDNMFRPMVMDNIKLVYYPQNTIWYEYGSGISTNKKNTILAEKIKCDWEAATQIMFEASNQTFFFKRLKLFVKISDKKSRYIRMLRYILFPRVLFWYLIRKAKPTMTSINADFDFYNKI